MYRSLAASHTGLTNAADKINCIQAFENVKAATRAATH